jgi:hypothetical protein
MGGKKTVVACALIFIMLFMWVRVFLGHRPAAAAAAPQAVPTESVQRKAPAKVKMVDLPKEPGRHDTIEKDFFSIHDRTYFRRDSAGTHTGTEKEVPVISAPSAQEVIQQVAKTMKLGAVLLRERLRASINDQLLDVGDTLTVKRGTEVFEFEVLQIDVDSVRVECEGIQLTLRLAPDVEVTH